MRSPTIVDQVSQCLKVHDLPAHALELEVTESVAMSNPEQAIEQLRALRKLGVHIAIDDFGTGYSSIGVERREEVIQYLCASHRGIWGI